MNKLSDHNMRYIVDNIQTSLEIISLKENENNLFEQWPMP